MENSKYENAEEWIKDLIYHVYDTGDIRALENALDELAGIWGLRLPTHEPKIERVPDYMPHSNGAHLSKDVWNMGVEMMKTQRREV